MNKSKSKSIKQPWHTKDAMEQVYANKLWGDNNTKFYSGEGSHLKEIVNPYIEVVSSFLKLFKEPITVCDLGCGDFNIGKQLVQFTKQYLAVDIVKPLIDYNKEHYNTQNLDFLCLDIAKDELPKADCVIIRQVLQHLSNTEIQSIAIKLKAFKYVILTEHVPSGNFTPNMDIISGQGIRLKKKSGLNLLASPFNFNVQSEKELLSVELEHNKGVIVTWLYQVF